MSTAETTSSHTVAVTVQKPEHDGHIWVEGTYGSEIRLTVISRISPEHAAEILREVARRIMEAAK